METERLRKHIDLNKMSKEDIIQEYINRHDTKEMLEGVKYYFKKNDIKNRVIYKYDNMGNKEIDEDAINNRLASGWHKLLVDQKVGYLTGEPVTFNSKEENPEVVDSINDILGEDFNDILPELVKNASNKGREWLHVYIDEKGDFDYIIVPAQEGIPIYDNTKRKDLVAFIRWYRLDDGTEKVEFWDDQTVTYYEYTGGGLVLDMSYEVNPSSHFYWEGQGYGWDYVPFIEFANNQERVSDLWFIKDYIDAYDNLTSDSTNTLEEIQDIFYILKGYDDTNLADFSANVRRYKAIKVSEDGGVDTIQAEMPINSLETFLNTLKENIYSFGMGVDINPDKLGNSPSGVSLRFLYSFLDMKASMTERKFTKAIQALVWFICEYLSIYENKVIDYKDITITFNKSVVSNEREKADIAQQSKGIISDETILENHPWVKDVQTEKERMEEQKNAYPSVEDIINSNIDSNINDDTDGDEGGEEPEED